MSADSPANILFDDLGNPIGVISDGIVYRLQVETTLSDGYAPLGTSTNPLRIDPIGSTVTPIMGMVVAQGNAPVNNLFKGYPVVIAGKDTTNKVQIPTIDGYGGVLTKPESSFNSDITSVISSTSSVNLLATNTDRKGATFFNTSSANLYLKLGSVASSTSFTVILVSGAYYEVPFSYNGNIDGIWASNDSLPVLITELT